MVLQKQNNSIADVYSAAPVTLLGKAEDIIVQLIILGPVFGLAFPPEQYVRPASAEMYMATVNGAGLSYPFTAMVTHLVTLFMFLLIVRHWRGYVKNLKYAALVLLQFFVFTSSVLWSPEPSTTMKLLFHLSMFILLAMHVTYRYTAREFIGMMTRLLLISGVLCLASIALLPGYSHEEGLVGYENAYRGLYLNKNYLGAMCSIGATISAYSFLIKANQSRTIYICFGANLLLLVLSRSATSGLITMIELLIMGITLCMRNGLGKVFLGFIVVGGAILLGGALSSVSDPAQLIGRSDNLTGRPEIWAAVKVLIAAKPLLGYGVGFWHFNTLEKNNLWAQLGFTVPHSHNDYLDILLQTGIVGLSFYALNIVCCILMCLRRIRHVQDGSLLCLIFLISFLMNGLTEALSLSDDPRSAFFAFCFQIYIWKLAFAPQVAASPTVQVGHMPSRLAAVM